MNDTDSLLVQLAEAMRKEGVVMSDIGAVEARVATLVGRARREARAESMLPLVGAVIAAERIGCTPPTVYNLVKRRRAKVKENAIAFTGT
jgi:hypothetical protein